VVLAVMIIATPVATRIGASPDVLKLKEGLGHKQGIAGFLKLICAGPLRPSSERFLEYPAPIAQKAKAHSTRSNKQRDQTNIKQINRVAQHQRHHAGRSRCSNIKTKAQIRKARQSGLSTYRRRQSMLRRSARRSPRHKCINGVESQNNSVRFSP
jgi:hypothetical protein